MSQVLHLPPEKVALTQLCLKPFLLESAEDHLQSLQVLGNRRKKKNADTETMNSINQFPDHENFNLNLAASAKKEDSVLFDWQREVEQNIYFFN